MIHRYLRIVEERREHLDNQSLPWRTWELIYRELILEVSSQYRWNTAKLGMSSDWEIASTLSQNTIASNVPSILQSSVIPDESYPSAKILFDFTPTSPFELAVTGKAYQFSPFCTRLSNIYTHLFLLLSSGLFLSRGHNSSSNRRRRWIRVGQSRRRRGRTKQQRTRACIVH